VLIWLPALLVPAFVALVMPTRLQRWAFQRGMFERSHQTLAGRRHRRPTHGGLVLTCCIAGGAAVAGPGSAPGRATLVSAALCALASLWTDRARGPGWLPLATRAACAVAVPLAGVRASLTGNTGLDLAMTALAAFAVIEGLARLDRHDATPLAVAAASASGVLLVAIRATDRDVAIVSAALVGACVAMLTHAWPRSSVRTGRTSIALVGATLTAAALSVDSGIGAPRSALVPAIALAVPGAALLVRRWDRRLAARRLRPHVALALAAACGAFAADALARGVLGPGASAALAAGPIALLLVAGLGAGRRAGVPPASTPRLALVISGSTLIILGVGVAATMLLDARAAMRHGRDSATDGLDAARAGNLASSRARFEAADRAFHDAASTLSNPLIRIGDVMPGVAQNLRNARTLADVGQQLAGTAVAVADRAGANDLQIVDGRFPIEAAREVSGELQTAVRTLRVAGNRLDRATSAYLVPELREGTGSVRSRLAEAQDALEVAAEATRLAPGLLGADGDRRWIVAVLSPSELRGAGGLVSDFAEIRTHDGSIDLVRTIRAKVLNDGTDDAAFRAALPPIYSTVYGGYRPDQFWQNISVTPDIPSMGEAIAAGFPLFADGARVDGVLAIDPAGIAALLRVTGPIKVDSWPKRIGPRNAQRTLLFDQYETLDDAGQEALQSDVMTGVVDALTSGALPEISEVAAKLSGAVSGGHLRMWSPEPDAQALFRRIGADGGLTRTGGADFVELVTQNASEAKIDWFLDRSLAYEPTIDPATGALRATATVTLTNRAPAGGLPDFLIGGDRGGPTPAGFNYSYVTLVTPHDVLAVTDASGERLPVNLGRERGMVEATVLVKVPPGGTATAQFTLVGRLPRSTRYRVELGHQPTVSPDRVRLTVRAVAGWFVVDPPAGARNVKLVKPVHFALDFARP
jgi:UDP-N-acetylmuramyl pentapeptide phosphotransferase/UDP-N-acetylglucosamine-1-phosphate transferase